ncbi:hypothetical protein G7Z17_g3344 [Cylindrodendrum hubeiense]|uniref:Uncharacterized protein n=1 Tax=Cylindrodendrum hubeiense TaxID=595255 RepID=A0A9P5HG05_9HYPO|nr:hypothetical protein G7Z17_g3344 [Cylindrodendrum hubeiense]
MCHGHPRHHPCAHTSINWHYCPSALIDLETGYETPCQHTTFAPAQSISSDCPLQNCQFKDKGGTWTRADGAWLPGPSGDSMPDMKFSEIRRGSASQKFGYGSPAKSHRRGSAFSLVGGLPPVTGEESSSSSSPSTSKSGSTSSEYSLELDHSVSKTKSSKKRHKRKSR